MKHKVNRRKIIIKIIGEIKEIEKQKRKLTKPKSVSLGKKISSCQYSEQKRKYQYRFQAIKLIITLMNSLMPG